MLTLSPQFIENTRHWTQDGPRSYHRGEYEGQCLPHLEDFDLGALPWNQAPSGTRPTPDKPVVRVKGSKSNLKRQVLCFEAPDPQGRSVRLYAKRNSHNSAVKRQLAKWRPSKARGEWQRGHRLIELGVPTALPLLWARRFEKGRPAESYLVTLGIEDALSFLDVYRQIHGQDERCQYLLQLGEYVRRLHDLNIRHADLGAKNILLSAGYVEGRPTLVFYLLDLDRAVLDQPVSPYRRAHNFYQLFLSIEGDHFGETERRAFYRGYSHGVWNEEHMASFDRAIFHIAVIQRLSRPLKPTRWLP